MQVLEILFLSLSLPDASVDNYESDDEDAMDFAEGTIEGNFATNEVRQWGNYEFVFLCVCLCFSKIPLGKLRVDLYFPG